MSFISPCITVFLRYIVFTNEFDAKEFDFCIATVMKRDRSFVPPLRPIVLVPERSRMGEVEIYL